LGDVSLLSLVLTRASGVHVERAVMLKSPPGLYWICVIPEHEAYWRCFKEEHPLWEQIALRHNAVVFSACPEFHTKRDLVGWLGEVLDLPKGIRTLLQICERTYYNGRCLDVM